MVNRRKLIRLLAGAVIVLGIALRLAHLGDVSLRTKDEQAYARYASRIAQGGPGASPAVFAAAVADPEGQSLPSPVRVAHTFLVAAMMRLIDDDSGYGAGIAVSWIATVLSMLLLARMGLRFFGARVALTAVFFLAVSMEELTLSRRAWQDASLGFFCLLGTYFAMKILRSPGRTWPYVAFHLTFLWCTLTKQTGLLVYVVAGAVLCGYLVLRDRDWKRAGGMVAAGAGVVVVAWEVLSAAAGGPAEAWLALQRSVVFGQASEAYTLACCEGPWWQVTWALFLGNPLLVVMAVAGIGLAVVRFRSPAAVLAAAELVAMVGFISHNHHLQNLRFMAPVHGVLSLLAAVGIWGLVRMAGAGYRRGLSGCAVILILASGWMEYRNYVRVAIEGVNLDLGVIQIRQILEK